MVLKVSNVNYVLYFNIKSSTLDIKQPNTVQTPVKRFGKIISFQCTWHIYVTDKKRTKQ